MFEFLNTLGQLKLQVKKLLMFFHNYLKQLERLAQPLKKDKILLKILLLALLLLAH
jgi:hypothetical protein